MVKVSVIMSSCNHSAFIKNAIDSILNQTYKNIELLIIDDNSIDNTFEIIKSYSDTRIKVFKNLTNYGMVLNTNKLIHDSLGDYIATINSDDYWEKHKLEKQVCFMEENLDHGACFTMANIVDDNNNNINKCPFKYYKKNRYQFLNDFFYSGNFLCYPSALIRKSVFNKIGYFNPAFLIMLDYEFWIRLCLNGYEIKIINDKLTNFRQLSNKSNLSAISDRTFVIKSLEDKISLFNFREIKNYDEMIKIFPDYKELCNSRKDLEGVFYLIDYGIKKFFYSKKKYLRKYSNFILELIHQETNKNPQFFQILTKDFNLDYKNYSSLVKSYYTGLLELKRRKFKKLTVKLLFMLITVLTLYFILV